MSPEEETTVAHPAVVENEEEEEEENTVVADPMISMQSMDREEEPEVENRKIMYGACAVGSAAGCFLCGPHAACLIGAGAAIGTYRPTAAGDVARAMGRFALSFVRCSRRKAGEIDTQFHLSEKAQVLSEMAQETQVWEKTRAIAEHPTVEHTKAMAVEGWEGAKQLTQRVDQQYRITERSWNGIEYSLDKMNAIVVGQVPGKASSLAGTEESGTDYSIESDEDEEVPTTEARRGQYAAVAAH